MQEKGNKRKSLIISFLGLLLVALFLVLFFYSAILGTLILLTVLIILSYKINTPIPLLSSIFKDIYFNTKHNLLISNNKYQRLYFKTKLKLIGYLVILFRDSYSSFDITREELFNEYERIAKRNINKKEFIETKDLIEEVRLRNGRVNKDWLKYLEDSLFNVHQKRLKKVTGVTLILSTFLILFLTFLPNYMPAFAGVYEKTMWRRFFTWEEKKIIGWFASKQVAHDLETKHTRFKNVISNYHLKDSIDLDKIEGLEDKIEEYDNNNDSYEERITELERLIESGGAGGSSVWEQAGSGDIYYNSGYVGIGTANPLGKLEVVDSSSSQLRLSYSGSEYTEFKTDANGNLRIVPTGNTIKMFGADIYLDSIQERGLYWGSIYNAFKWDATFGPVYLSGGSNAIVMDTNDNSPDAYFAVLEGSSDVSSANELMRITKSGDMGLGTNSPDVHLHVSGTGLQDIGVESSSGGFFRLIAATNSGMGYKDGTLWFLTAKSTIDAAGNEAIPFVVGTNYYTRFQGGSVSTANPDRVLEALDSSNPQFRLTYTDGSVYTDLQTDSSGDYNISPTGDQVEINGADIDLDATQDRGLYWGSIYNAFKWDATFGPVYLSGGNNAIVMDTNDNSPDAYFAVLEGSSDVSSATELMRITKQGNLGVSTPTPDRRLDILDATNPQLRLTQADGSAYVDFQADANGDLYITSNNSVGNTDIYLDGNIIHTSDISKKKDIRTLEYGLQDLMKLNPVNYNWKNGGEGEIGFIAQEIKAIIPEVVHGKDGNMGVAYAQLTALAIKAIQEQQLEIEEIKLVNSNQDDKILNLLEDTDSLKDKQDLNEQYYSDLVK
ncbi:MAG: hypothetical protein GF347_03245, partial [Candidatus Moranbacteria bacterium]|nr:hypothetical protein [Candidatus Moranbacteria bacterium]